jgi:hypothetical protein
MTCRQQGQQVGGDSPGSVKHTSAVCPESQFPQADLHTTSTARGCALSEDYAAGRPCGSSCFSCCC